MDAQKKINYRATDENYENYKEVVENYEEDRNLKMGCVCAGFSEHISDGIVLKSAKGKHHRSVSLPQNAADARSKWDAALREAKDKELRKFREQKEKTKVHFFVSNGGVAVSNLVSEWELLQSQLFNASERVDTTIRAARSKWTNLKLSGAAETDYETKNSYCFGCTELILNKDLQDGSIEILVEAIKRNSLKPVSLLSGIYITNRKNKKKECYPINAVAVAILAEDGELFLGVTLEERISTASKDGNDIINIDSLQDDESTSDARNRDCEEECNHYNEDKHLVCFLGKTVVYERVIRLMRRRQSQSQSRCSSISHDASVDNTTTNSDETSCLLSIEEVEEVKMLRDGDEGDEEDGGDETDEGQEHESEEEGVDETWQSTSDCGEEGAGGAADIDPDQDATWVMVDEVLSPTAAKSGAPAVRWQILNLVLCWLPMDMFPLPSAAAVSVSVGVTGEDARIRRLVKHNGETSSSTAIQQDSE